MSIGQALRRADDPTEPVSKFHDFWIREGAMHFRTEEEVLLPRWKLLGNIDATAAARVAKEHLELRAVALELTTGSCSLTTVREFGEKLVAHVRFEERELFTLIEDDLGLPELELLAAAVVEAEQRAADS